MKLVLLLLSLVYSGVSSLEISNGTFYTEWIKDSLFQLYPTADTSGCFQPSWTNASVTKGGFTFVVRKSGYRVLLSTKTLTKPGVQHESKIADKTFISSGNQKAFKDFDIIAKEEVDNVASKLVLNGKRSVFYWNNYHDYAAHNIKENSSPSCRLYVIAPSVIVDAYLCQDENDIAGLCTTKKSCTYVGTKQADAKDYEPVYGKECA